MKNLLLSCFAFLIFGILSSSYAKIHVVAAENQYGSVAKLIGGDDVEVTSIINNADGDPHSFISSIQNAKLLEEADVIIYNGADYDSWINPIVKNNKKAKIIAVQDLQNFSSNSKFGLNPHLWYDPQTFPTLAKKLTQTFSNIDTEQKNNFQKNLADFNTKYSKVFRLIDQIKDDYDGTPVTATEPLFGYMAEALGFEMLGESFQWTIMNDSEPSPKMMIDYQNLLKDKKVKVLFYNEQVTDNVTKNILAIAKENNISVVGITETMPQDKNAISWMINSLQETQQALAKENKTSTACITKTIPQDKNTFSWIIDSLHKTLQTFTNTNR